MVGPRRRRVSTPARFAALTAAVLLGVLAATTVAIGHDGPAPFPGDVARAPLVPVDASSSDEGSSDAVPESTESSSAVAGEHVAGPGSTVSSDPSCGLDCTLPPGDATVVPVDQAPPVHHPVPTPALPVPGDRAGFDEPPFRQAPKG